MNVAKYLLLAVLMLPLAELAAFIAVAAAIGFFPAVGLAMAGSFAGLIILQRAGGVHIERMRVALGEVSFTSLQADGSGTATLVAGILMLIPGFITDVAGLVLLVAPLRRSLAAALRRGPPPAPDGVVDLDPAQWHQVPDARLPNGQDRNNHNRH